MAKVLVVDDERSYCEYVGRALACEGHEVRVAGSGREGIEIGCRFRPDVLVVDWMLKAHVHGLHVCEAVAAAAPAVAAILVTGFASRDLRAAAERGRVFRFVEKPFELEAIREAVDAAACRASSSPPRDAVALVETDGEGRVVHATPAARALFRCALGHEQPERLDALFRAGAAPDPEAASQGWVSALLASDAAPPVHARTQPERPGWTRLWILRPAGSRVAPWLTEMVLGVEEPRELRWPFPGRVLVVDDNELFRHMAVALLESAGAPTYAAETESEALRLLAHDEGVGVLLVDCQMPGTDVPSLVAHARDLRPELRVIRNSALEQPELLTSLEVPFLRKPWRVRDLVDALAAG